jgi:hypothetical protein
VTEDTTMAKRLDRTEQRRRAIAARRITDWVASFRAARAQHEREAADLRDLRRGHAVLVRRAAERAGVSIGTPGAVPGGLVVDGHAELVREMRRIAWLPLGAACLRGFDDDDDETVRVLRALDDGFALTAAAQIAAHIADPEGDHLRVSRTNAGARIEKHVRRDGAYDRWRSELRESFLTAPLCSVAGESIADWRARVEQLAELVEMHDVRVSPRALERCRAVLAQSP